jgi:4-diphosphocytidyl-2-C-methyl-D-erythritol kinase
VPFFLTGGDQFVQGIGEILRPITMPQAHYLILFPGVHCPTGPMFQDPALNRNSAPLGAAELAQQDFLSDHFSNAFEAIALRQFPEIARAQHWLIQQAGNARLSGSGSALFAQVASAAVAQEIQARCPLPWQAWSVCSTA